MVFSYSDKIILDLIDDFDIEDGDLILDPFNGTGTTTFVAKKEGIDSIGTDTSPISVLASRVKATWDVDIDRLQQTLDNLEETVRPICVKIDSDGDNTLAPYCQEDRTDVDLSSYDLAEPEKTPKGWLSEKPRKKMLVIRHHIDELPESKEKDLLQLAMCAVLPENIANISFGPEAYKVSKKENVEVLSHFKRKVNKIIEDLKDMQAKVTNGDIEPGEAEIINADARNIGEKLYSSSQLLNKHDTVDYVITSPPYPAEHDYTRNQRLELIWLGVLENNEDLQQIKKRNIRSNTKNIYVDDNDAELCSIRDIDKIDEIVSEMESIIESENIEHGFGQYYPRVVEEYFAGMQRHLEQIYNVMSPGGKAGYVVADSGSYWQVDIPTGEILGEIASSRIGFDLNDIKHWRGLNTPARNKDSQNEEILIMEKPN